jgi:hypothetical protein
MFIRRVFVAGVVASLVMGMLEMVYEGGAGAGFWSPVVFIGATILRDLRAVRIPVSFLAMPVLLGLMGHMMNSVILAFVFARLVAPRLEGMRALVLGGGAYGLAVFAAMWFGVVPLVDPVLLKLNGGMFAMSHLMWGAALGAVLAWRPVPAFVAQHAH